MFQDRQRYLTSKFSSRTLVTLNDATIGIPGLDQKPMAADIKSGDISDGTSTQ